MQLIDLRLMACFLQPSRFLHSIGGFGNLGSDGVCSVRTVEGGADAGFPPPASVDRVVAHLGNGIYGRLAQLLLLQKRVNGDGDMAEGVISDQGGGFSG